YRALPVAATCGALVTETSQVWPIVAEEVAIARDIEAVRPAPVVVALLERRLLELARCSKAEVVIHQYVPQFTGAAAQAVRPYIGSGAHQDPRGVQRRSTKENQRCLILDAFLRHGVNHAHAARTLAVAIVENLRHYGEGLQGEPVGRHRRG